MMNERRMSGRGHGLSQFSVWLVDKFVHPYNINKLYRIKKQIQDISCRRKSYYYLKKIRQLNENVLEGNEKQDELSRKGASIPLLVDRPEPFCGLGWET